MKLFLMIRYLSLQLLERRTPPSGGRLEVKEVEVFGWGRECGDTPP